MLDGVMVLPYAFKDLAAFGRFDYLVLNVPQVPTKYGGS